MTNSVRMYRIRQELTDTDKEQLHRMSGGDICFFRFAGGDASAMKRMLEDLLAIKLLGVFLIGIFRFPFRFEGKRRLQTAIHQYHQMSALCDATTYLLGEGMLELVKPGVSLKDANQLFEGMEAAPVYAIEKMIRVTGDMNIDVRDIQTFLRDNRGPVYIHSLEGDDFDEPLKYLLNAPHLPQDYADGSQLLMNVGYARDVDMMSFQQLTLRFTDAFHKAELFKLGTYCLNEPGQRIHVTLMVTGLQHPYPRPADLQGVSGAKIRFRRQVQHLVQIIEANARRRRTASATAPSLRTEEPLPFGLTSIRRDGRL